MIHPKQIGLFQDVDTDQRSLFGLNGKPSAVTENREGYCVIEPDNSCVWGYGLTYTEARVDAIHWMKDWSKNTGRDISGSHPATTVKTDKDLGRAITAGKFRMLPCTAKLMRDTETFGGSGVDFEVRDGVVESLEP